MQGQKDGWWGPRDQIFHAFGQTKYTTEGEWKNPKKAKYRNANASGGRKRKTYKK